MFLSVVLEERGHSNKAAQHVSHTAVVVLPRQLGVVVSKGTEEQRAEEIFLFTFCCSIPVSGTLPQLSPAAFTQLSVLREREGSSRPFHGKAGKYE